MRLSELLRRQAEQTLADMIYHLLSRLPTYDKEHADDVLGETHHLDSPIKAQLHRTSVSLPPGERNNIAAAVAADHDHEEEEQKEPPAPVSAAEAAKRAAARVASPQQSPAQGESSAAPTAPSSAAVTPSPGERPSTPPSGAQQQQQHTNVRGVRFTPGQNDDHTSLVSGGERCFEVESRVERRLATRLGATLSKRERKKKEVRLA